MKLNGSFKIQRILFLTSRILPELVKVVNVLVEFILEIAFWYSLRDTRKMKIVLPSRHSTSYVLHFIGSKMGEIESFNSDLEISASEVIPIHRCFPLADLFSRAIATRRGLP